VLVRLWQGLRDESGQTLIVGAISLLAVIPFLALAIDVGQFRYQKRQMQSAVDAAAVAGAIEISSCGGTAACSAMQTAMKSSLTENGFTIGTPLTQCAGGSGTVLTLWVNNGPCSLGSASADPNYGNSNYVEAVLAGPVNTFFARMFGIQSIKIVVRAEAYGGSPSYCLYTSPSNSNTSQSILLNGGTLNANCGIFDDSSSSGALVSNSGVTVNSTKFLVAGGWSPNNGGTFSSTPVVNQPAVSDPLSYLTAPTAGSCTSQTVTTSVTLNPATFCYGFNLNPGVTVTLNPGTYIIEGGVNVNSTAVLQGTGVTLYFTGSGQLQMNSGSTAQLSAPTSGSLAGILIWEASSDSAAMIIDGNASAKFEGAIYAPSAQLTLNSGGNTAAYTVVDVGSMILDSGANFTLNNNYSSLPGGSPLHGSGSGSGTNLVE
jgi:Flp pilus assembly protein TadG